MCTTQEWSEELAKIAQTWADQCDCVFHARDVYPCYHEHGGGRDRSPVPGRSGGQNLAWRSIGGTRPDWRSLAKGWYDEVKDFPASYVSKWGKK